jgi:hypothetical protein
MMTMLVRKGIHAPSFVCDVCGKQIRNADHGMVKFASGDRTPLFFCHKRDVSSGCDRKSDDAIYPCWHELSTFLIWLEANTPFNRKRARFRASFLEGV